MLIRYSQGPDPLRAEEDGLGEEAAALQQETGGTPPTTGPQARRQPLVDKQREIRQGPDARAGDREGDLEKGDGRAQDGEAHRVLDHGKGHVPQVQARHPAQRLTLRGAHPRHTGHGARPGVRLAVPV